MWMQCGSGGGKRGLLPSLPTCCLVAEIPLLPAPHCSQHRALHQLPAPSGHRHLCPAPWSTLESSFEALREPVVISRLRTVPFQATCRTGMCSAVGSTAMLCAAWPEQGAEWMGDDHTYGATTTLQPHKTSWYHP